MDRTIHDGKLYFLIKSKYPSDGVSASKVYFDYCDLETTLNYAKLGTDFMVSKAYNLLPAFTSGEWALTSQSTVIGDYKLEIDSPTSTALVQVYDLPVVLGLTYNFQCLTNGGVVLVPKTAALQNANQGSVVAANGSASITVTGGDVAYLRVGLYNSDVGEYIFENPILTQSDQPQHFQPQEKYTCGFSVEQTVGEGEIIEIDGTALEATKNDTDIITARSQKFADDGLKIIPGINHLAFSTVGGLAKVRIIDEGPKHAWFGGLYLPKMQPYEGQRKFNGSVSETSGNYLRVIVSGSKASRKTWEVATGKLTREEWEPIELLIDSAPMDYFWLYEFGGGGKSVKAFINPESLKPEITPFGRNGKWHPDGKTLSFTIEEAE